MSSFGKHGYRCDWCGKIANNIKGEYERPKTNAAGYHLAGYIKQPNWEREQDIQSSNDICDECEESRCPYCGSEKIVSQTPVVAGPDGWGGRCKDCGKEWGQT
jgi:hypothetical protein